MRLFRLGWLGASTMVACCAAVWGLPTSEPGTAPPATAPATQSADGEFVAQLIRDLSSDDFRTRATAEERLVMLGDAAEAALKQAASATGGETEASKRADRALRQIGENRHTGPTVVTLHFKSAPAKQVFQELARQGGFPLSTTPANLLDGKDIPPVTIDVDHRPFWEAVRELAKTTGIFPRLEWGSWGPIRFCRESRNLFTAPNQICGPVVLVARSFDRAESLDLTQPGSNLRRLSANFTVMFEPRMWRRGGATERFVTIDEATTAADEALADGSQELGFNHGNNGGLFDFSFSFLCPESQGGRIRTLRGELRYKLPVRTERIEVDFTTGQDISKSFSGWNCDFTGVGQRGQEWTVMVQVKKGSIPDAEWQVLVRGLSQGAAPQLLDANGLEFTPASSSVSHLNGIARCEYVYFAGTGELEHRNGPSMPRPEKPEKLTWSVPLETKTVTVPFEFKDIPLP